MPDAATLRGTGFTALLAVAAAVALTFLALPLVALVTQVPLGDLPHLLGTDAVRETLSVTLRTNALADALILLVGTRRPTCWARGASAGAAC